MINVLPFSIEILIKLNLRLHLLQLVILLSNSAYAVIQADSNIYCVSEEKKNLHIKVNEEVFEAKVTTFI